MTKIPKKAQAAYLTSLIFDEMMNKMSEVELLDENPQGTNITYNPL